MTTEHTPGPWKSLPNDTLPAYSQTRRIVAIRTDGHRNMRVAETYDDNHEANARLIAAAPTMYLFVASKADSGDTEAMKIIQQIGGNHAS